MLFNSFSSPPSHADGVSYSYSLPLPLLIPINIFIYSTCPHIFPNNSRPLHFLLTPFLISLYSYFITYLLDCIYFFFQHVQTIAIRCPLFSRLYSLHINFPVIYSFPIVSILVVHLSILVSVTLNFICLFFINIPTLKSIHHCSQPFYKTFLSPLIILFYHPILLSHLTTLSCHIKSTSSYILYNSLVTLHD